MLVFRHKSSRERSNSRTARLKEVARWNAPARRARAILPICSGPSTTMQNGFSADLACIAFPLLLLRRLQTERGMGGDLTIPHDMV